MPNQNPSILVVLPTLGQRLDTLSKTLESINIQRAEVALRLIVVTPTRAKEARQLALTFGAEIVDDPGIGISSAINKGLEQRSGEQYYAWMGDDDLFLSKGLVTLQNLIEKDKRNVVAYGACKYIDPQGRTIGLSKAGKLAVHILGWGPDLIPHPGSLIDLDALFNVGLYDEDLKYVMDLDVFLKLKQNGPFISTKNPVSAFRWHPESLTVANRKGSATEAAMVKRRYLSPFAQKIAFLWEGPVFISSSLAAKLVNSRARKLSKLGL